ncbi:hypothetical protein CUMW_038810 [Citrus unshiu]|nr:hypothetical protein CUMW_038810 [Citrus unshiu]
MDSPINVTRSTSVKNGDIEVQGWASSSSRSSKNKIFPFSTALSSSVPRNDSITSSLKSKFDNGVFLTWKDLSVVVPSGKKENRKHAILQELTGYVEPGQILAIMGPSGCGKSTLLDALAGRLSSNTEQTGEILINGRKETLAFGTSAYVTQEDTLMTTLTVMEAVYYSAQLQLPDSMSRYEKRERAEMTIREMGLQDAMDTRIGGWNVRGISGGQKRRVSICIEILTCPKLLFLDEPTSGLDSAASYHVMKHIVNLAHEDGITVVASIHQPSSDVFELFHNLCLLAYGKTIYFGHASMTEQLFASNGFPCPSLRNPSDHYLRTINKDFEEDIEEGIGRTSTEEVINILVNSYKSSDTYSEVQERVSIICQHKGETLEKESQASFITQSLVLTKRSFVNMYRDLGYYWLRFAIYVALGLCIGTIFHDIGSSYGSIQARGSMLMFIAAFLTFMAIGGFPSFVEDMKIFGRERLNGHYGVASFVLSNSFSSTPYLLLISLIPGAIAYYLTGLQKNIGHFLYFVLGLFVSMMLSLMMIVASIVPDFLMGIITGAGIQGIMMLNGGFFRLPNDLPKPVWKIPMHYIAFHRYFSRILHKNEFEGLTFPNNQAGGPPTITGKEVLTNIWQVDMGHTKWVDLAILFGMLFFYRFFVWRILNPLSDLLEQLFASNGFPCPSLRNPSDHYLRIINKDFEENIEEGTGRTSTEEVINILVNSYKSSDTYNEVKERVSIICQQKGGTLEKGNQANFITQSLVLTKRSFVNMYRDLGYYWLRFAIYVALGLCIGTIFHDIGSSYGSIQARGSMLMYVATFLTFMAIGGFPSFVEDMKIFERERLNGHYGVASFVLSNSFSSTPYLLLISLIPGAIAYYLTGLQKNIGHFLYFVLGLFVSMMLVESLMMIVASIVPDFLMGIITGAGIQGIMMLNGGFFRLPNDLPKPVWKYPMYLYQGFYKNEFEGLTFPNNQAKGPPIITGKEVLTSVWQVDMGHSKWIDLAILLGMLFFYRFLFWAIIKTTEKFKPIIKSFRFVSFKPCRQM